MVQGNCGVGCEWGLEGFGEGLRKNLNGFKEFWEGLELRLND
jgi:hypothetical protein